MKKNLLLQKYYLYLPLIGLNEYSLTSAHCGGSQGFSVLIMVSQIFALRAACQAFLLASMNEKIT